MGGFRNMTKPADWTLPELAVENNKLNKGYFKTGEYKQYPAYYKIRDAINWILKRDKITSILEVGCGSGWQAVYLKKEGLLKNIEYYGLDISETMCKFARENFLDGDFVVADILYDDVGKQCDVVTESAVLELVEKWEDGVLGMIKCAKEWLVFHRLFFKDKKTILERVPTYNNIEDIRWHIGLDELNGILDSHGFKMVFEDVWAHDPYKIGTFIARRVK